MRNPWGSGEWKGKWSDNSDMWEKHPEVKRFLRPESKDDGKFWISKEDFSNNFEAISICMSSEMLQRADKSQQRALARALADFKAHPGMGMSEDFSEQMFISPAEAREMCKDKPKKWMGYVELPEDPDPTQESGVMMLRPVASLSARKGERQLTGQLTYTRRRGRRQRRRPSAKRRVRPPSNRPVRCRHGSSL